MTRLSGSLVGAEALLLADGDFETKRCKLREMEDGLQTSKLLNRFCSALARYSSKYPR